MQIIPAVDLLGGKVVRLKQGNYDRVKVYSGNPIETASKWKNQGASLLHVVDLDGARAGLPYNLGIVKAIIKETGMDIELGGGIRNTKAVESVFLSGVSCVVLGTAAIIKRNFSVKCITKYGSDKIIFSLDTRNEAVFSEGWKKDSGYIVEDLVKEFENMGLKRLIYTDISKAVSYTHLTLPTKRIV